MIFDAFYASVGPNVAINSDNFAEVGDKLVQVACMVTPSLPKLLPIRPNMGSWTDQGGFRGAKKCPVLAR